MRYKLVSTGEVLARSYLVVWKTKYDGMDSDLNIRF